MAPYDENNEGFTIGAYRPKLYRIYLRNFADFSNFVGLQRHLLYIPAY